MRGLAICVVLIACGDNARPVAVDAPPAPATCTAQFSGNFDERVATPACATVTQDASGSVTLGFSVPSTTLDMPLAATFDLGVTPADTTYVQETVHAWTAQGVRAVGQGYCLYVAGADQVPQGSFRLVVDHLDVPGKLAHGTLTLAQDVLVVPTADCGDGETEDVQLSF